MRRRALVTRTTEMELAPQVKNLLLFRNTFQTHANTSNIGCNVLLVDVFFIARIFNLVGQVFRMLSKIKWRWICLISSLALCCWIVRVCGLTSGFIVCLVVNMVLALVYVVQAMSQWWPQCHFYWRCECLPRVSDSGNLVVQPMHCRTVSIGGWLHHCSGGEKTYFT